MRRNDQLAQIARTAIRLYAISFLFTGIEFYGDLLLFGSS